MYIGFYRAAQFNRTKLISLLVENGAKVNTHDGEGRSPFLNAVAAGHIGSARLLLKLGADLNATDLLMKTCVHIAVENEQLKMLSMLLDSRPRTTVLYKADLWDRVPLHYAAKSKDVKVKTLIYEVARIVSTLGEIFLERVKRRLLKEVQSFIFQFHCRNISFTYYKLKIPFYFTKKREKVKST